MPGLGWTPPIKKQKKSRARMLTVGKGKGCASDMWAACKDAAHGHLQTRAFCELEHCPSEPHGALINLNRTDLISALKISSAPSVLTQEEQGMQQTFQRQKCADRPTPTSPSREVSAVQLTSIGVEACASGLRSLSRFPHSWLLPFPIASLQSASASC